MFVPNSKTIMPYNNTTIAIIFDEGFTVLKRRVRWLANGEFLVKNGFDGRIVIRHDCFELCTKIRVTGKGGHRI